MDALQRLEEAARKAREFTYTRGEHVYTLRRPTRTEAIEIAHRRELGATLLQGATAWLWLRYQLEETIVGWLGVRERDISPAGTDAPLPWSRRAVVLLLDAMPDADFQQLALALQSATDERDQRLEADAGN